MFKKFLPILSLALILVLGGFGCKGITAEQKAATQPVALEYWTIYDDVDAVTPLIDQYRALRPYPGIR